MNLVIVESPTKAKTIKKFLGQSYTVTSSYGHMRDLPKSKMGIDIEKNFTPHYVIPTAKRKAVNSLKKQTAEATKTILATDEDREGEAIAWHLMTALNLKEDQTERIVFHEITPEAITKALENPRRLNMNLVDAQQARRVLDRLVGYELSPFLWRKVAKGLSAGRVQSVAVRLIVEREREIQKFKSEEYWTIEGEFSSLKNPVNFPAKLYKIKSKILEKLTIHDQKSADKILVELKNQKYYLAKLEKKTTKRQPKAPFTTSTLQQEANRRLGYSAKQTMMLAQQLYEGIDLNKEGPVGLITYMRTDSVNLAGKFLDEAQNYIKNNFGAEYALKTPRAFKKKSKLAQEAHEAIRPTNIARQPAKIKQYLTPRQHKLYELIWQRAAASQMAEAILDATSLDINTTDEKYTFRATGIVTRFSGFLKIYPDKIKENILPELIEGEKIEAQKITPQQHFTQPPARYSDAGLVKTLEEHGIGRPSTYAPTIGTIIERSYITREEKRLKPAEIAFLVNDLLVKHFPKIVDYQFTAKMEDKLDEIAQGKNGWQETIHEFYQPFHSNLMQKDKELSKKEITEEKTDEKCDKCGSEMVIKRGRFGKFLACSGFPECRNTKQINDRGEKEEPKLVAEKCDKCGSAMQVKHGRYGEFLGCSAYPNCKNIKPLNKTTGVKCTQCEKGEIVEKRSKKGRLFYACNQYPSCKFALWSKPIGEKCPNCESLMVLKKGEESACSNKGCNYQKV